MILLKVLGWTWLAVNSQQSTVNGQQSAVGIYYFQKLPGSILFNESILPG